jgi:putative nucleotidyltransferase with HDIG domain
MPIIAICVFASISFLITLSCLYLYYKSNRDKDFLYACFPFICSALLLFAHIQLTAYATPETAVYWTKIKYLGVFGYLIAFPLFISSLSKKKVSTTTIGTASFVTILFFIFTFSTDLVVSDRVVTYGNSLRAEVGILYPYFMLVFFGFAISCFIMYIRIFTGAKTNMKTRVNYTPITIGLALALVLAIIDVAGLIIGKPVIESIPYPFVIGTVIFLLSYLWSFLSQYSWFFVALDKSHNQIIQLTEQSNKSVLGFVQLIARTLDAKDHYTAGHSLRVMDYAVKIAKSLDLPENEIELLKHACLLHDIGKIGIPDGILNKETPLSEKEREHIFNHPVLGKKILSTAEEFREILDIIYTHHERVDGHGYPSGLKKDEIPLLARIIAVADTYDAMRSERPYRKALTKKAAIVELKRIKDSQLDGSLVETFIENITRNKSLMS